MKRKLLSILLTVMMVCSVFMLTACDDLIDSLLGNDEPPHEHEWSEWKIATKSTCEKDGMRERTCECGESETEVIDASGHKESDWQISVSPTCTKEGSKVIKCTECNIVLETEVITPAHQYENDKCVYCGCDSEEYFEFTYDKSTDSYEIRMADEVDLPVTVILPSTYHGKAVTSIDSRGFWYAPISTKEIIIPDSIVSIGWGAFEYCTGITSVIIPSSVTYIGEHAFSGCTALADIVIPDSVTYIGKYAFSDCTGLNSVVLGKGIDAINERVFSGCTGLTSITIPDSITSIGEHAFLGCTELNEVHIEDLASWCGIDFSSNPLVYAKKLYLNDDHITDLIIPDGVTAISDDAFRGYNSLTSVVIGGNVTSIGSDAFRTCDSLTSVVIGDSVTSIGDYAFWTCDSLTSVVIGKNVSYIGNQSFGWCENIEDVFVTNLEAWLNMTPYYNEYDDDYEYYGNISRGVLHFLDDNGSEITEITIPDSVKSIPDCAFMEANNLTGITIGDNVTSIGKGAFAYCKSLTSITIPKSVTYIGNDIFYDCEALRLYITNVEAWLNMDIANLSGNQVTLCFLDDDGNEITDLVIPHGITTIRHNAFEDSTIFSVVIPNSVTTIDEWAFNGCRNLTKVVIPDSVTSIGERAFEYCESLASITIPDSVTSIGYEAFYGCNIYTIYNESDLLLEIGSADNGYVAYDAKAIVNNEETVYANDRYNYILTADGFLFREKDHKYELISYAGCEDTVVLPGTINSYCYSLREVRGVRNVIIPESFFTEIGYGAFRGCPSLTSVVIPNSVTSIDEQAFNDCRNLTKVVIPDSVTSIGERAFISCDRLSTVVIGKNVVSIGRLAFADTNLTEVYIPKSVAKIDEGAFDASSIISITVDKDNEHYVSIDGNLYSKDGKTLVQYATGKADALFEIPDGVTTIGDRAFFSCDSLTEIVIPDSVTSIGEDAFYGCTNLTSVVIPDSVTTIGDYAFSGCSSLVSVDIGDSVKFIGSSAFAYCSSLTDVYYKGTEEEWKSISIGSDNSCLTGANIHYNYVPEK